MDLNAIGNSSDLLLRNQQQAQLEQISALAKTLGLKAGSQFLAEVQKVSQATPEQRAELIKTLETALSLLNKNSAAPAVAALIEQLLEQKNLAQSPALKLISLIATNPLINNQTAATTNLLTYTTQPLAVGQTLLLQLNANQRVQLLQPIGTQDLAKLTAQLAAATQPQKNDSQLDLAKLLASINETQQPAANIKTAQAISETLRLLLPQKDKGQDLLSNLPRVMQFIQQVPVAQRKEWLSNELQQSLKTLANQLKPGDQLSNPKLLEMAIKNNGQGFENKLAQLSGQVSANSPSASAGQGLVAGDKNTPPNALLPNISAGTAAAGKTINAAAPSGNTAMTKTIATNTLANNNLLGNKSPSNNSTPGAIEKLAAQDLKGALLNVRHHLERELKESPTASAALVGVDVNKSTLATALPQFLGLLMQKPTGELNQKQLRTQLILLLHQYTLGSLAKIQLQQIHTINHQLTQTDQAQPTQSWQVEIPLRQGQEVHPLQLQFEQQWVEDPNETASKENKRVRQWNIMLGFDLPVIGKFYAQLCLLGTNLSAKFWAENAATLQEAKLKMDSLRAQLEQEGIEVAQLQCVPGLPPQPKMSFSYSLVDIKT